ncbi:DUF58 domain-containing protein [Rhodohalobacter sp. SW132]|uniref:DUF58 domain-containing protein n=1 Tax=Rhodohalobacter sp. SW132 TaxID=2293433 RepID=UPI000E27F338|nr:DUF58 domain-containing protein [Rhodohalobacter sp. SW132]REL37701.1 DUF58 domain-containing protein [Rhodohalobacter sp. SW132]
MISKDILSKIKKLEIQTKGLVNNLFGGEYQSAFKGRGMEFSEVRAYTFGDDIRLIDWNVTARNDEPYIKVFEEEREQTMMLCVDISPSGFFGSHSQTKMELAIEVCAVIAFSAIKNGDKVGMVLFSDKIEKVIPPKKGRTHVLRLIRELYVTRPTGNETDIGNALSYINRLLNRRAIIVLASDFQDEEFQKQHRITNRKHDLVNLLINDQFEDELPDVGLVTLQDAETGTQRMVDTSNNKVREFYREQRKREHLKLKEYFRKNKMDSVSLKTNESYVKPLISFFQRRTQRR